MTERSATVTSAALRGGHDGRLPCSQSANGKIRHFRFRSQSTAMERLKKLHAARFTVTADIWKNLLYPYAFQYALEFSFYCLYSLVCSLAHPKYSPLISQCSRSTWALSNENICIDYSPFFFNLVNVSIWSFSYDARHILSEIGTERHGSTCGEGLSTSFFHN